MKRVKLVVSVDDFHPSFPGGKVRVIVTRLWQKGSNRWRVAVWGDDDFGMEKDNMDIDTAFTLYRKISDGVSIRSLSDMGFVSA